MDKEKKDLVWVCLASFILCTAILVFHWLAIYEVVNFQEGFFSKILFKVLSRVHHHLIIIRLSCLGFISGLAIFKHFKVRTQTARNALIITPVFLVLFLYGYSENNIYAIYIFPIFFVSTLVIFPLGISYFLNIPVNDNNPLGINKKKGDSPFAIPITVNSPLIIPNIDAHASGEGGAGTGKTQSLIIPSLKQYIKEGRAGIIYDYEGDISLSKGGYITKAAYTYLQKYKSEVRFAIVSMSDLTRTVRVNPIAPRYIKSFSQALEISTAIVFNLNPELASPDKRFWADNSIYAIAGTMYHFITKQPSLATMPHVIEFITNNFKDAMKIIAMDEEVAPYIQPVLAPILEKGAGGQTAGASATTQFSLVKLRDKKAYYVLSPNRNQEMDLDISNPKDPILLCLSACKPDDTIIPILGSILQKCILNMNLPDKQKSFILVDELSTIYIHEIEKLMAVARKHGVSVFLTYQTFTQLEEKFGKQKAKIIIDNCASQFVGRTSVESAERISKLIGEYEKQAISRTYNDSSPSQNISDKYEKIIRVNDITNQPDGHFTGIIGGGKPTCFSTQLKGEKCPVIEIPPFNPDMMKDGKVLPSEDIDKIVNENFDRIRTEINDYINSYFVSQPEKQVAE